MFLAVSRLVTGQWQNNRNERFPFNGRNSSSPGGKYFPCVLGQILFPTVDFPFPPFSAQQNREEETVVGNFWTLRVFAGERIALKTKDCVFNGEGDYLRQRALEQSLCFPCPLIFATSQQEKTNWGFNLLTSDVGSWWKRKS